MSELDLPEWLALWLKDVFGPHADEIIDGVREYGSQRASAAADRIEELEAKLAQAVESLDGMVGLFSADNLLLRGTHLNMELTNARNILSELRRTRRC